MLEGAAPVAKAAEAPTATEPAAPTPAARSTVGGDGVIDVLSDDEGGAADRGTKRKAGDDGAGPSSKAARADDDVIELD